MEDHAYIGTGLITIGYCVAAFRLHRLARTTREVPERLLSVAFFFTAASEMLYLVPLVLPFDSLWTPFTFAGRVAYLPAAVLVALFTARVFRGDLGWTRCLVVVTGLLLVAGIIGSAIGGDWEGYSIRNAWFWLEWAGYTLPFAWAGGEALGQHRRALCRVRLGLCEPLVCNRYLLWALFALAQVCLSFILLAWYRDFEQTGVFAPVWDSLYAAGDLLSIGLLWLVFFPPASYRRWIDARNLAEAS